MKKRVYFWGGICWHTKTPGVAWTAADNKVVFKHTKNLCHDTLFEDEGEVFRVVETRAAGNNNRVSYVKHFDFPDSDPPEASGHWFESKYSEVKEWHDASRAVLTQRDDLKPPSGMQDTAKTLEIYNQALYPTMCDVDIDELVEDNASR